MKSRLVELDYMRGLACIAVVLTHITALGVVEYLPGSSHKILATYINRSFNFTVPVFIFLSGLTGFLGYHKKPFNYKVFLSKRLGKILIPYILWVFFYYASFIIMGIYVFDIQYLIKSMIFGDMSYHLYFIVIIVQLYLLSPLFYYAVKRWNNKYFIGAMGLLNLFFMVTVYFPYSDRVFFKYMFFYILGISAALNVDLFISRIKKYGPLCFMAGILVSIAYAMTYYNYMASSTYYYFIYCVLAIFFLAWVGIHLKGRYRRLDRLIEVLSDNSYYIYLGHPFVINILTFLLKRFYPGIQSITLKLLILVIIVPTSTLGAAYLYSKMKKRFWASSWPKL